MAKTISHQQEGFFSRIRIDLLRSSPPELQLTSRREAVGRVPGAEWWTRTPEIDKPGANPHKINPALRSVIGPTRPSRDQAPGLGSVPPACRARNSFHWVKNES